MSEMITGISPKGLASYLEESGNIGILSETDDGSWFVSSAIGGLVYSVFLGQAAPEQSCHILSFRALFLEETTAVSVANSWNREEALFAIASIDEEGFASLKMILDIDGVAAAWFRVRIGIWREELVNFEAMRQRYG